MVGLARKSLFGLYVICLVVAFGGYSAWAAVTLSFNPLTSTVGIGNQIGLDINVSGLEGVDLGTFDLNSNYEDTFLSFDSYVLGNGLNRGGTSLNSKIT